MTAEFPDPEEHPDAWHDREFLEEYYRDKFFTAREIAEHFGVKPEQVGARLRTLDIRRDTDSTKNPAARKLMRMDPDDIGGASA